MTYRVPTNAHPFITPSADQLALARPWRGSFVYPQSSATRNAPPHEVFVTAAETEGDNRIDMWNAQLFLHFTRAPLPARDLSGWLQRNSVPLCAFMPDRISDSNANITNHRTFQSLSQMLNQNQMVAFAPFNPSRPRSPGILIFPTNSTTDALLVGAVVLNAELVDVISNGAPSFASAQLAGQAVGPLGYQQPQQVNPHDFGYSYPQQQQYMYSGGH